MIRGPRKPGWPRLAAFAALTFVLSVAAADAGAAARFARTSGNWTTITWGTSCTAGNTGVPAAADDVTICDGVTVTVNASQTVNSISMPAGGTNTILQINSAQVLTTGSVTMTAGTGAGDHRQLLLSNGAGLQVSGSVTLNGGGANDRWALLQINGSSATIGANLVIDGLVAGNDRARVTLSNTSTLTVGGNITLDTGGLLDNGNNGSVILLGGNFTHVDASDDYTSSGGEFRFTGSVAQALNGGTGITTTFSRLTINKPSGDVTINHPAQVANAGTLTLASGRVVTGSSYVGVGTTAAGTITGQNASSYIVGNLRRYIPTGTQSGILFPVGGNTASRFAQVQIDFPNISTAGTFQVAASTGNTDHPNIATSAIDSASSVNRYWTLTNAGGIAFSGTTTANVTFNYPASDIDSGANTSAFIVGDYSGGTWSFPSTGALTATSTQATGLNVAALVGDFAVGELVGPYSYWAMNEGSWNGTAGEVVDGGSGGNNGNAASLSATRPTTASTTPAIAGSPGTCRYGVFNRANKDYVSLPTTYPNLATQSFTITAWIRTTDRTQPGQRILIDDETEAGGWGFSLADSGTAGALRIYSRGSATQTIDTAGIIANNTWYFVAASISISGTTTVVNLYVYSTAGAVVGTANATWTGFTWGNDPGRPSIGGETNASPEGNNAFGFAGNIDELRVYRAALSQQQVNQVRQLYNPCVNVDHYAISGSTTGVTCDVSTVQFTAHDAAHAAVSPAAGTVLTLTTATGTGVWQSGLATGTGAWTPSGVNNGSATYIWPGAESSFSVRLRHNTVANVNLNVLDANGKAENVAEDLTIAFANTAFRVTDSAGTATATIGTQISAKNSNTGFGAQTLFLQAIRTDTNTGSCVGLIQGQTVTIEMAAARVNPTGGSSQVSVMNSSSAMVALGTGAGTAGAYTSVSLAFDAQSKAPLVVNYPNAGSASLFARYQLPSPPTGTFVTGTSNTFVVRPFGFRISGPPNGRTGGGSTAYAKAGVTWTDAVTVTAVQWVSGEDANNDGIPDSDAVLAGNATTTNFGVESPAATATLSHTLAEPAGGATGALTAPLSAFTNGVATASASYSEVGIINLFATTTSYLGSGQNVSNSAAGYTGVGRFTPFDFAVTRNAPVFAPACPATPGPPATSAFTYVGQVFNFGAGGQPVLTVTARNQGGATTQNYVGTFMRLVSGSVTPSTNQLARYSRFDALGGGTTPALDLSGLPAVTADPAISTFINGVGTLTFSSGSGAVFTRGSAVAPFNADIALTISLTDQDGIVVGGIDGSAGANPVSFGTATAGNGILFSGAGGKRMLFGRMRLLNAIGSPTLNLPVPLRTEYFTSGGYFITNTDDSCTGIQASDIRFDFAAGNLTACETRSNPTGAVAFLGGVATYRLTAPGSANAGAVDLSVNLNGASGNTCIAASASTATNAARPWLRDNAGSGSYLDNPRSRATFGVYKGSDEFIWLRELY